MAHLWRTSVFTLLAAGVPHFVLPRRIIESVRSRIAVIWRWLLTQAAQRRKTMWILVWVVALVPMIRLTWLVRHYGVEVPTLDDWAMAPLIVKAHTGQLTFADIFEQQQEARTVLPKLIFVLSAARGHWDVRDQMMLSVASCWLTAAGIFVLLRRSQPGLGTIAVCFWLAVLTIFTLAQYEVWIFASGFPSFLPALFLVAALVAVGTRFSAGWKFLICAALAVASSFTLPHGLLAWGLTFPALLLRQRVPRGPAWLGLWAAACAACATVYFWDYHKPAYLPAFAPAVSPLEYAFFFLEFLGGGLAYSFKNQPALAATLFGALQLALYLSALVFALRRFRDRTFREKSVPWFALGLYALGSAFLATLGRVGYGASYSLASRYVPFSLYLTVAVIALVAIIASEIGRAHPTKRSRTWIFATCLALAIGYLIPFKFCSANTLFFLRAQSAKDRLARGAVLFSAAFDTSEVIKKTAYPNDATPVLQNAAALDQLKLIRPSLVRTNRLNALSPGNADGLRAAGSCEMLSTLSDFYRASGWAVLNAEGRPADCVLVAYQDPQTQEWIACAISDSFEMRADVMKRFQSIDQLWSGWAATFSRSAIPAGAPLSFWAVNANEAKLYRLADKTNLTVPPR
jgi:hypothetical protein